MKILHIQNPGAYATYLQQGEQQLGHTSHIVTFQQHPYGFPQDFMCHGTLPYLYNLVFHWTHKYDVLHFHAGIPRTLHRFFSWKLIQHAKCKKIYTYHGSNLREAHLRKNHVGCIKAQKNIYVTTPDLLEHAKNAVWIPAPFNLSKWSPPSNPENRQEKILTLLYYPRSRGSEIQGTPELLKALKKLERQNYPMISLAVAGVHYRKMVELLSNADVVVGKISRRMGWYSYLVVEALALNKPTITYIKPSLRRYLDSTPFIETDPDQIYETLRKILENQEMLDDYRDGRKFVQQEHDHIKIAKKWLEIYYEAD